MGGAVFSFTEFTWTIVNLVVLALIIALPIWLVIKINSIDQSLKEILRRDKDKA